MSEIDHSAVYRARDEKAGRHVAIKVYKNVNGVVQFQNELTLLKCIIKGKTPHVVEYVDDFEDDFKHCLVLELAESSLFKELRRPEHMYGLPEFTLQQLILQLGCALELLASLNVVHRDLKPGNILLWKMNDGRYLFKLCDFGNSRLAAAEMDSIAGTVPYAHPTVIHNYVVDENGHVKGTYSACEADLWPLGTLIFHCATGKQAFDVSKALIHRNADLDRLLKDRPKNAVSGRIQKGEHKYIYDLPQPCRYPKLFKDALVRYILRLLDCKAENFSFTDNMVWATEFARMKPALIFHHHQSQIAKFYNTENTAYFKPTRPIEFLDILPCESQSAVFLTRTGMVTDFDPLLPEWKNPPRNALTAVVFCYQGTADLCPRSNSDIRMGVAGRVDERLVSAVRFNQAVQELSTVPSMLDVFHQEVTDLAIARNEDYEGLCQDALRFCVPHELPEASLNFSAILYDQRLKTVAEQVHTLRDNATNDMLALQNAQEHASSVFTTLEDSVSRLIGPLSSMYELNHLYEEFIVKQQYFETQNNDTRMLATVRKELANAHEAVSAVIHANVKKVFFGEYSQLDVLRRHRQLKKEYSSYMEMIASAKAVDVYVQNQARASSASLIQNPSPARTTAPIVRLNEISELAKAVHNTATDLMKLSVEEK
ncbi:hypothetical protein L596_005659 [Steinernema carpocapsae]|uniref:IkappaB kinase n=1 Tax=Steinernema carpocapsae TaxID=34508 RepID=A0A4U8V512_STECR|nr:hypothetical protein L596_005659 [Steinernema carpocapsae]